MDIIKAHAYGNDFLFVPEDQAGGQDRAALARSVCARQTGVGADGLVFYRRTSSGATMKLFNADGSAAEVSGNAVRCLAAIVLRGQDAGSRRAAGVERVQQPGPQPGGPMVIETDAGKVRLTLLEAVGHRYTFRAETGPPRDIRMVGLDVGEEHVQAVTLSVGNPQCVVLGPPVDAARLQRLGPALSRHPLFPAGTNVELVDVETPARLRMLIWERGVGPTAASGTGACAAAVAAASYGGARREVEVVSPGGSQWVAWGDDGLQLTGWAEVSLEGHWIE